MPEVLHLPGYGPCCGACAPAPQPQRTRPCPSTASCTTCPLIGRPRHVLQALIRRAKALEQLGQHKAALADIQKANRLDTANEDSRVRPWFANLLVFVLLGHDMSVFVKL